MSSTITVAPHDGPPRAEFEKRAEALHKYLVENAASFNGDAHTVSRAIDEWTSQPGQGMMTFKGSKLAVSKSILEKLSTPPKVIVELGGFVGASAVGWGAMLKDLHNGDLEGCKVYSCELDPKFAGMIRQHIAIAGLDGVVEVVTGKSEDSLRKLKADGTLTQIDMLFIDHWEKYYKPDLMLCEDLGLLREGTIVLADNTDMPGAPEYVEYVKAGGRGGPGSVKYETKTYFTQASRGPTAVEATLVVAAE